jgi:hypothetical protein
MFLRPEQLGRLNGYLVECRSRSALLDAQLSAAVRTSVDETRLGLQLLTDATNFMHTMRHNFMQIDQYCKDVKVRSEAGERIACGDTRSLAGSNLHSRSRVHLEVRRWPRMSRIGTERVSSLTHPLLCPALLVCLTPLLRSVRPPRFARDPARAHRA